MDLPDIPTRLVLLAAGQYRYTEPESDNEESGFVEFVIHPTNGTVEISTAGAPMVPWGVLTFIAIRARHAMRGADDSTAG